MNKHYRMIQIDVIGKRKGRDRDASFQIRDDSE